METRPKLSAIDFARAVADAGDEEYASALLQRLGFDATFAGFLLFVRSLVRAGRISG